MFRLQHVEPGKATGKVAEAYGVFPPGMEPALPMQILSASPDLAQIQAASLRYFIGHERLDLGFLAMIRYLAAQELGYEFCFQFNAGLLKKAGGLDDAMLQAMADDPMQAPLEESQKLLLAFVLKALRSPKEVTREEIQALRDQGWQDSDIMDAVYHAASMFAPAILLKAFTD